MNRLRYFIREGKLLQKKTTSFLFKKLYNSCLRELKNNIYFFHRQATASFDPMTHRWKFKQEWPFPIFCIVLLPHWWDNPPAKTYTKRTPQIFHSIFIMQNHSKCMLKEYVMPHLFIYLDLTYELNHFRMYTVILKLVVKTDIFFFF